MAGLVQQRIFGRRPASDSGLPDGPRLPAPLMMAEWVRRPVHVMERCRRRYGDTWTMSLSMIGTVVLFTDPDVIKEIFTGPPDKLHAGEANTVLQPMVGPSSLLLLDGARHMRDRRLMLPPFHGERMQTYGDVMHEIAAEAVSRWPVGEPFETQPRTQEITLDVILRTVFGIEESERLAELRDAITGLLADAANPLMLLPQLHVDLGRLTPARRMFENMQAMDRILFRQIRDRQQQGRRGRDDVLSMLVEARDEQGRPMSLEELRDELVTLLVAGHETTATSLCWCLHRLLEHPRAAARVYEEVDRVVGDGPFDPRAEMPYLDGFIRETLRLNPIIPLVGRRLKEPMRIGGRDLPEGVVVSPCIYMTHRREDVWPDPERFDPERFVGKRVSPYQFLPFGGGVRRCLGMAFALYEMRVVLATVLSRFEVQPAPGHRTKLVRRAITFAPSGGMPIVIRPRG